MSDKNSLFLRSGVSVYISAFTLMAIAIDRFFVIIYPFKARMPMETCLIIIIIIWVSACLLTLPYGYFVKIMSYEGVNFCDEEWPHETSRKAFGLSTSVLQFVIPFIIISFCYIRVCSKLSLRARSMPGAKSARKEEQERERTRKTNRMLISMVVIFGISWLPLNTHNLVQDFYIPAAHWQFSRAFFLLGKRKVLAHPLSIKQIHIQLTRIALQLKRSLTKHVLIISKAFSSIDNSFISIT